MIRPSWKSLMMAAVFAGAMAVNASPAEAHGLWWRHHAWVSVCDPCWVGVCDPCCVSYRPLRPLYNFVHRPFRWCCGWRPWCHCYVSFVSEVCCEEGRVVSEPATAPRKPELKPTLAPPKPEPERRDDLLNPPGPEGPSGVKGSGSPAKPLSVPDSAKPGSTKLDVRPDSGLLTVHVPAGAKVFINGLETRSTGTRRQYVSHGLAEGKHYPYQVQVLLPRNPQGAGDGRQWAIATRTVYLTSGDRVGLNFADRAVDGVLVAQGP